MAMVEEGEESGAIERNEKELIENVFEFNNTTAEDVMIHRTDMVTLSLDDDEETILSAIRESGLSRFPVYGSDLNDILGILNARDLLLDMASSRHRTVRELMRPAYLVPETLSADDLFRDMQHKKVHLAVVIDEYGELAGVVSLEDLLEEIVGNIYDIGTSLLTIFLTKFSAFLSRSIVSNNLFNSVSVSLFFSGVVFGMYLSG